MAPQHLRNFRNKICQGFMGSGMIPLLAKMIRYQHFAAERIFTESLKQCVVQFLKEILQCAWSLYTINGLLCLLCIVQKLIF